MASCTTVVPYTAAVGFSTGESPVPLESSAASRRQKFSVTVSDLRFDSCLFTFVSPLHVLFSMEEDAWYCADEREQIVARGESPERALHSFSEDFAVLWEGIAGAPDEQLTLDAQALKRFLRSLVKEVKRD